MDILTNLFANFQDATDVFSIGDVVFVTILSFLLSLIIGWVYKITYKGVSYTQSYVHTLIMMSMVVAIIMLIIGSNIARAFSLVGALSIIRFRNAVKGRRDTSATSPYRPLQAARRMVACRAVGERDRRPTWLGDRS